MKYFWLAALTFFAIAAPADVGSAAPQQTFVLSKGLLFDCRIAPAAEQAKSVPFEVSYFVFGDRVGPQVNFYDPSKLITDQTGWMGKDHFVLSRVVSDGRLFAWVGQSPAGLPPQVDALIEIEPTIGSPTRASISLTRFVVDGQQSVSTQAFGGNCESLSGKAAWDHFQQAPTK